MLSWVFLSVAETDTFVLCSGYLSVFFSATPRNYKMIIAHYCSDVHKNYYVNSQTAILKYCSKQEVAGENKTQKCEKLKH